jgi:hypothetical protein
MSENVQKPFPQFTLSEAKSQWSISCVHVRAAPDHAYG